MGRVGDAPHYYDKANGLLSPLVHAVDLIEIYAQVAQLAQHTVIIGADLHHFNVLGLWSHAKPIRNWRKHWPRDYERLLHELREYFPEGRGVRELIAILRLHQDHPVKLVEQL